MKVFYGWINVGVLLLVYMLLMMPVLLTFGVVLTPMTEALQINATTASLAYSIMSLLSGLCAVAAGMFAKKIGNKQAILLGSVLVAMGGFVMYFFCNSTVVLYLCYIGFFSSGLTIGTILPINTIISQWFQKRRGVALAIVSCGAGIAGFVINPIMANILEKTNNWRNIYLCIAIFALFSLAITALLVKNHPSDMNLQPDGLPVRPNSNMPAESNTSAEALDKGDLQISWTINDVRRTLTFYLIAFAIGICSFTQTSINTHAIPHLENIGFKTTIAATVVGTFSLCSIPSRLLSGFLCDRISCKKVLTIGYCGLFLGIVLLKYTTAIPVGYAFAIITGVGYGLAYASLSPLVADFYGTANFGLIYGAAYSFAALINAVAPTAMGACKDLMGDYSLAWTLLLALIALALIASLLLRKPQKSS